jgi:hypothetical protein
MLKVMVSDIAVKDLVTQKMQPNLTPQTAFSIRTKSK